jgi:hypothetical protein
MLCAVACAVSAGPLQIPLVDRVVPFEDSHRLVPCYGHDAEVVNPGSSGVGHKGMPEIVKGGVAHAGRATCPLKCMRAAGRMVARVHNVGVRLPGIYLRWVDERPRTTHVSCTSFERACQCLAQWDKASFSSLRIAWLQADCAGFEVHLVPPERADFSLAHAGVVGDQEHRLQPGCGRAIEALKFLRRKHAIAFPVLPLQAHHGQWYSLGGYQLKKVDRRADRPLECR